MFDTARAQPAPRRVVLSAVAILATALALVTAPGRAVARSHRSPSPARCARIAAVRHTRRGAARRGRERRARRQGERHRRGHHRARRRHHRGALAYFARSCGTVTHGHAQPQAGVTTAPLTTLPTTFPSWNGDFSTGNFMQYDSFVDHNVDGNPSDFMLVHDPAPSGFSTAFEARLQAGSSSIKSGQPGERALTTLWPDGGDGSSGKSRAYAGADTWYRDEVYFPAGFEASRNTDFNWVYELHNYPDDEGDSMLSCGVDTSTGPAGPYSDGGGSGPGASPQRFSCRIFGGGSPAHPFDDYGSTNWSQNPAVSWEYMIGLHTIPTGQWLDMVWHIHWDCQSAASGGTGMMQWWINGNLVGTYNGPTLLYLSNAPGTRGGGCNQAYLQTGYYRPDDAEAGYAQPAESVYHAATMIGPTAASIGETQL